MRPVLPLAKLVATLVALALLTLGPRALAAPTLQAPAGGKSVPMPEGLVACGTAGSSEWTIETDGKSLRPPVSDTAIGHVAQLKVAPNTAACATTTSTIDLVATAHFPQLDAGSVVLSVDEGRVDLRGHGLRGIGVHWQQADHGGDDRCVQPETQAAGERCSFSVARALSAGPNAAGLTWFPAGGRAIGPDVTTFDATGRRTPDAEMALHPARVILGSIVPPNVALDLSGDVPRIPLAHPEAIADVDCGVASCDLDGNAIVVRSLRNIGQTLGVRVRFAPHVFFLKGTAKGDGTDVLDPSPSFTVAVLPCAMSVASGDALRGIDDSDVVVKLDARCAAEAPSLRFTAGSQTAQVKRIVSDAGAAFVLLRVGRLDGDELAVTALRGDADASVVGVARAHIRPAPQPRVTLELENGGPIDFIPTNRNAVVRFSSTTDHGRLVLLPLEGVYETSASAGSTSVRGVKGAAGFVALRFGYRVDSLPASLMSTDLAVIDDPLQRPLKEANVPAAIGASAVSDHPLVELLCGGALGEARVIKPGVPGHIPYAARDTCRIVFHRERLTPESGAQRLNLEVNVTRVDGETRPEAHVAQSILLRPAPEPRYAWIKGVAGPFDHITIRVSHDADENNYVAIDDQRNGEPSVQWSVVAGEGVARIYATASIPTGLYRVSDRAHSGILSLNLGVIARLTWLDSEGHGGFLGVEGGVMGVGLANDIDNSGHSLTQVATVFGAGLSVPIANRSLATETSINLHAWGEYEVSRALNSSALGSPFGFVFGPSISVGNVGTNL